MAIDKDIEAKIVRYHFVEQWRVGAIATQLGIHHPVVDRVLSQAGLPKVERSQRPSTIDPYLPFIIKTLAQFPTLAGPQGKSDEEVENVGKQEKQGKEHPIIKTNKV